jgi:ABC-type phosphate/phosphonate transport system substrate-binding protein
MLLRRTLILLAAAACAGPAAAQAPAGGVRIGMVQGMFRDVQPALVQALSRPLRELISRQSGLTGDVQILPDAFALADQMAAGKFEMGVFHGFEFAWVRERHPELVPFAVTVPPGRALRAVVVVRADSKVSGLADLADEPVLMPRGSKAHCHLYLERQRAKLPANCAAPKHKPAVTAEEALDQVVSGDAAAAIVDATALTGYGNLQPGAARQLRVLVQSERFPPTVIAYNKKAADPRTVEVVRRLLLNANQTPAGKPLMMLWSLQGFEDVPADYDAALKAVRAAYPPPAVSPAATAGK